MYRWLSLVVIGSALGLQPCTRAVTVVGETAANSANPGTGVPWDRVGIVDFSSQFDCTGVYLGTVAGQSWVLTANHVGAKPFSLDGVTFYSALADSAVHFNTGTATADLLLYQIDTFGASLGGPLLEIAGASLASDTSVTMVGYSGGSMRWGTNTPEPGLWLLGNDTGTEGTVVRYTDKDAGVTGEAQGAIGDSGGAVFSQDAGGTWSLSGIMVGINNEQTRTYFVDLSYYRPQIMAAIPEPSAIAACWGGAAFALALLWRQRRR